MSNQPLFNSSANNNADDKNDKIQHEQLEHEDEKSKSSSDSESSNEDNQDSWIEFFTSILTKFDQLKPNNEQSTRPPTNWKEVHSPEFMPYKLDNLSEQILQITNVATNPD